MFDIPYFSKISSNNLIICLWRNSINILNKVFHLFIHIELDMYLGIHVYLHILLISEFPCLWIQKWMIHAFSCYGPNKATFPYVFTVL